MSQSIPSANWRVCYAAAVGIHQASGERIEELRSRRERREMWGIGYQIADLLSVALIALVIHAAAIDESRRLGKPFGDVVDRIRLSRVATDLKNRPRHEFFAAVQFGEVPAEANAVQMLRLLTYSALAPAPLALERIAVDSLSTVLSASTTMSASEPTVGAFHGKTLTDL
ncbi:hypothetical protein ACGFR6_36260 [Streptomyces sp. NPDC048567]|uniref:hypothetical protein n=1 Tax=Streptomyces sp. NPDC048567 TaxID=3365570 RepID=UPI00371D1675